jgi:hypothetical protein
MAGFSLYPEDGYGDVVKDVLSEWEEAAGRAVRAGLPREALVMDPGLGFAKSARQTGSGRPSRRPFTPCAPVQSSCACTTCARPARRSS